jgi:hypothetical protein
MEYHKLSSLSRFERKERKEYQELKNANSIKARKQGDRATFLGCFVIVLLATLVINGSLV